MSAKPFAAIVAAALFVSLGSRQSSITSHDPSYTVDGQLRLPENYREWVYQDRHVAGQNYACPGDSQREKQRLNQQDR